MQPSIGQIDIGQDTIIASFLTTLEKRCMNLLLLFRNRSANHNVVQEHCKTGKAFCNVVHNFFENYAERRTLRWLHTEHGLRFDPIYGLHSGANVLRCGT